MSKRIASPFAAMHELLARLYGPAARYKPKSDDLEKLVLRFCIRPIDGAFELLSNWSLASDPPRQFCDQMSPISSNNIVQKGLEFGRHWSGTVR